jgi:CheY-like chemotaxis protein
MLHQSDENYSVTRVNTAEHALEVVKKQPFDLFILDYHLPEISGVEVCRNPQQKGFKFTDHVLYRNGIF